MLKLLTDRTNEIPPFLLRSEEGLVYPDIAVVTAPVTKNIPAQTDVIGVEIAASAMVDEKACAAILAAAEAEAKEHAREGKAARALVKKAEKERLQANKVRQKKEFLKHFKWDFGQ